jgi:hypothetical protein
MRRGDLVREREGRHFGRVKERRARVLLIHWEGTGILEYLDEAGLVLVERTPSLIDPYRTRTVTKSARTKLTEWMERRR